LGRKKCFFIAPIGDKDTPIRKRSDQILNHIIKPAVEKFEFDVTRADEISRPGLITNQIIERLWTDELVIADLFGNNPNVYYELALRHAFNKPFIQMQDSSEDLPFDIQGMRTIRFDYRFVDSMDQCREEIIKQVKSIVKDPSKVESPVSYAFDYVGAISKGDPISKAIENLSSEIDNLSSEIMELQSRIPRPPQVPASGTSQSTFPTDFLKQVQKSDLPSFSEIMRNSMRDRTEENKT